MRLRSNPRISEKRIIQRERYMMLACLLPFMALVFVFAYFPLHGWIYAFFDYRVPQTLSDSEFVGFKWFSVLFRNEVQFRELMRVMKNTFGMSFLNIATSIFPMLFAILLNEIGRRRFKSMVQTLTTIPNFISWVLVYFIAFSLFSYTGMINNLLLALNWIQEPIKFLDTDKHVWLTMVGWTLWKGLGWGAILYLASIASISLDQYEAATIDGATRIQQMRHVTFPSLLPTYFVLLMLSVANFLNNGMEQYYIFQNAFNKSNIEVLDLYVYNVGITGNSLSFTTAISMMKSIISVVLLFTVNGLSKKLRGSSIF